MLLVSLRNKCNFDKTICLCLEKKRYGCSPFISFLVYHDTNQNDKTKRIYKSVLALLSHATTTGVTFAAMRASQIIWLSGSFYRGEIKDLAQVLSFSSNLVAGQKKPKLYFGNMRVIMHYMDRFQYQINQR